jgi:Transposase DDE domain
MTVYVTPVQGWLASRRGITARIARIGVESSERLDRYRWGVERTNGWLLSYKGLALRYDRTARTINALIRLAITLICARRLPADRYSSRRFRDHERPAAWRR